MWLCRASAARHARILNMEEKTMPVFAFLDESGEFTYQKERGKPPRFRRNRYRTTMFAYQRICKFEIRATAKGPLRRTVSCSRRQAICARRGVQVTRSYRWLCYSFDHRQKKQSESIFAQIRRLFRRIPHDAEISSGKVEDISEYAHRRRHGSRKKSAILFEGGTEAKSRGNIGACKDYLHTRPSQFFSPCAIAGCGLLRMGHLQEVA